MEKRKIIGLNLFDVEIESCAQVLGCEKEWPLKNLGLPLGGNPKSSHFWAPLVEKMEKRLCSWKKNYISLGGRSSLIKSTLSNLSTYYLSIFKASVRVVKEIEKMRRNFLWEPSITKKDHLIKWDVVCGPVDQGGLDLGHSIERNDALLAKWLWRFAKELDSLCHLVISSKYAFLPFGWDSILNGIILLFCLWRIIEKSTLFFKHIRYELGRGDRIRFWEDVLWGDTLLSLKFRRVYLVSRKKGSPLSQFYSTPNPFANLAWDLSLR